MTKSLINSIFFNLPWDHLYLSVIIYKYYNFSLISPIDFNFFLKYDRVLSVLFTLKVLGGFIRRYKNYKQIARIKFIILFSIKS